MEQWYKVFVSSTYDDLTEERQKVVDTLLKINCIPTGMEYFPSTGEHQWSIIQRTIDQCDYYLLILAGKYGSINKTGIGGDKYRGLGYTEMEYLYAISKSKPIIAFLHGNIASLPSYKTEQNQTTRKRLDKFKSALKEIAEVQFWENPDELCAKVSTSLHSAFIYYPRPGLAPQLYYEKHFSEEFKSVQDELGNAQAKIRELQREVSILMNETDILYQLADCVYVYTRDKKKMTIKNGTTALDFAFILHPHIGLGAKLIYITSVGEASPSTQPFNYVLQGGDTINIVSDSGRDGTQFIPHATSSWFQHLHTDTAKKKLARFLNSSQQQTESSP